MKKQKDLVQILEKQREAAEQEAKNEELQIRVI